MLGATLASGIQLQAYLGVWIQQGGALLTDFSASALQGEGLSRARHRGVVDQFVTAQRELQGELLNSVGEPPISYTQKGPVAESTDSFNPRARLFSQAGLSAFYEPVSDELRQLSYAINLIDQRLLKWTASTQYLRPAGTQAAIDWLYQLLKDRHGLAKFTRKLGTLEASLEYYFNSIQREQLQTANFSDSLGHYFNVRRR